MPKRIDLTGQVYGRLTVLSFAGLRGANAMWNCECACGNTTVSQGGTLKNGSAQSCGCLQREAAHKTFLKHGEAGSTKEYNAWRSMRHRCTSPECPQYQDYGGRGITICPNWLASYEAFVQDVGRAPSAAHTLDRIAVDGNYEPGNVQWATRKEQQRNRRCNVYVLANGEKKTLSQVAEETGYSHPAIKYAVSKGWDLKRYYDNPKISS